MTKISKTALLEAPATLPVTAAELRSHIWTLYPDTEDSQLEMYIKAATSHIETITWRRLVSQQWRLYLQDWPAYGIALPFGSVRSLDAVRWLDDDGVDHELAVSDDYIPAIVGPDPMVIPVDDSWPAGTLFDVDAIRVDFTAGFGAAADVPADLRHAIMLLAAHWYEVREAVMVGTTVRKVPYAVDALIAPWKVRY